MTQEQAQACCDERNRGEVAARWLARRAGPDDWEPVRVSLAGLAPLPERGDRPPLVPDLPPGGAA